MPRSEHSEGAFVTRRQKIRSNWSSNLRPAGCRPAVGAAWASLGPTHAANGLGRNRVEQFGFCFGPLLVWWQMVASAISLVRFWFEKEKSLVWFGCRCFEIVKIYSGGCF